MIYESSYAPISIHRTRKGAEMAMEFHKAEALKEFNEDNANRDKEDTFDYGPFGQFEAWDIFEFELLE